MTASEAQQLAATLRATGNGHTLRADVVGEWITFSGGSNGMHSVAFSVSSPTRVLLHWAGYAANNGVQLPPPKPAHQLDAEIAQALRPAAPPSSAAHVPTFSEEMMRKYGAVTPRQPPVIGSRVTFESGSAASGLRVGVVNKVTKTRVLVDYKFKHGGEANKWVKIVDLLDVEPPSRAITWARKPKV